tara:strand:- start:2140 stop:2307 length:168 start_codon:yes stop_codon:yes gene_type:complete
MRYRYIVANNGHKKIKETYKYNWHLARLLQKRALQDFVDVEFLTTNHSVMDLTER